MECFKNIWIYIFIFLYVNVLVGQEDKVDSFLEISEVGEIKFEFQGAFWHANEKVVMAVGGVDSLDRLNALNGQSPIWQTKINVYENAGSGRFKEAKQYDLPFEPTAFGASVITADGLYCIGGMSPNGNSNNVFKVNWNAVSQKVEIDSMPRLPAALSFAGATYFQQKIYVARGVGSDNQANQHLFILDLNDKENGWIAIETPMEKAVRYPSLTIQSDGEDDCLFIVGGTDESDHSSHNIFKYNLKTRKWKNVAKTLGNDTTHNSIYSQHSRAIGNSSILFIGQTKDNWINGEENNFHNKSATIYNTITNAFVRVSEKLNVKINDLIGETENGVLAVSKNSENNYAILKLKFIQTASGLGFINSTVLFLYFALMLLIGVYFSKKQKTADDYFKAGKKIPFWAAGLSILGTGLSAITFMAVPAKTFATDWAYFVNRFPSFIVAIFIAFLYIPVFRRLDVSTAYEYLQKRFNLATRLIGSFSFIVFQLGRIGIVLFLPAVALNVATGFEVITCILLVGIISLVYTFMGGIEAVIWTDVIQVIILYGGIILCVVVISFGLKNGVTDIISIGQENNKYNIFNMSFNLNEPNFWVVVFGSFFTNLTTYGSDQTIVQRYLTTKTTKDATKSIWMNIIIGLTLGWIFFFMGTALFAYYKNNPGEMLHTMTSNDAVFPWYIISQLPKGVSGILIAGIFAASMSSLSSSMNSAATAYTMDFHKLYKRDFNAVNVGRAVTLIIGIGGILFAILFATMNVKSIWDEFLKIIGLFTGGLGGVFLLGLVTEKANGAGVLIGLLISAVVQYFVGVYQPFNLLLYTASGFITCFVFGYLFSLILPTYDKPIDGLTIYSVKNKK